MNGNRDSAIRIAVVTVLLLGGVLSADDSAISAGFFGTLDATHPSVRAFNLHYSDWLVSGLDTIANGLSKVGASPTAASQGVVTMRRRLRQDASMHSDRDGPFTAITKWTITSDRDVQRTRLRANNESNSDEIKSSRINLALMERELAIVEPAVDRPSEYAKQIERLIEQTGEWLRLWESTERVTGVDAVRHQVQPVMAAEAEKWRGMARLEIASALRMRNHEIPGETPTALESRFQEVLRQLPVLTRTRPYNRP